MSRPTITRHQKRFVSVLVGNLLLFVAILAYSSYGELFHSRTEGTDSVSRLQITEFKLIYDEQIHVLGALATDRAYAQRTGSHRLYLIDVRSAGSFATGHIHGAISIPEPELEARISSVVSPERADALIVLYCA